MADFSALKEAIQDYIKQNGNEEITGEVLQTILLSIVNTLGDSAINDLITALNAEVAARQNADGSLEGAINQEGTLRSNADSTLQGNINAEATARENADTALSNRLGSTITAENTAAEQIGAEAEARAAADTALRGLIDGITDNIENGYVYAGIATPSSTPATGKVFYLALTAGTYTHFGNTVVTQGINILKYNGSAWSLDAFIGIDDELTPISNNLPKSGNVLENIIKNGSAFDLSAYNAVDGVLATYADLDAALTALNALPAVYKQGGMSMKFVLTSDNNYMQFRCTTDEFTTDVTKWQGVDDELTAGSDDLVKSGTLYREFTTRDLRVNYIDFGIGLISNTDGYSIDDSYNTVIYNKCFWETDQYKHTLININGVSINTNGAKRFYDKDFKYIGYAYSSEAKYLRICFNTGTENPSVNPADYIVQYYDKLIEYPDLNSKIEGFSHRDTLLSKEDLSLLNIVHGDMSNKGVILPSQNPNTRIAVSDFIQSDDGTIHLKPATGYSCQIYVYKSKNENSFILLNPTWFNEEFTLSYGFKLYYRILIKANNNANIADKSILDVMSVIYSGYKYSNADIVLGKKLAFENINDSLVEKHLEFAPYFAKSSTRVLCKAFLSAGKKINLKIKTGHEINISFYTERDDNSLVSSIYWAGGEDFNITVPSTANYFKLLVRKAGDGNLDTSDTVETIIKDISVFYKYDDILNDCKYINATFTLSGKTITANDLYYYGGSTYSYVFENCLDGGFFIRFVTPLTTCRVFIRKNKESQWNIISDVTPNTWIHIPAGYKYFFVSWGEQLSTVANCCKIFVASEDNILRHDNVGNCVNVKYTKAEEYRVHHSDFNCPSIRIPSNAVDDNGNCYCVFEVRKGTNITHDYYSDSSIALAKVSNTGDFSYREVFTLPEGVYQLFDPQICFVGQRMYCFISQLMNDDYSDYSISMRVVVSYSDDYGTTWTEPTEVIPATTEGRSIYTSPNNPLIYNGSILIPIRGHKFAADTAFAGFAVVNPTTLTVTNTYLLQDMWLDDYGMLNSECAIYSLNDGYVYLSCRDESRNYHNIFRIRLDVSEPAFELWSVIKGNKINEGWKGIGIGNVLRSCCNPIYSERKDNALYISQDGGVSFDRVCTLADEPTHATPGYSVIAYNRESDVLCCALEDNGGRIKMTILEKKIMNL